jgi:hypothetical protein
MGALSESFAVQLGSQQRTPYHVRLVSASVSSLVDPAAPGTDAAHAAAVRAQTALSLYARGVAGVVLLVPPDAIATAGARGLPPGAHPNMPLFVCVCVCACVRAGVRVGPRACMVACCL